MIPAAFLGITLCLLAVLVFLVLVVRTQRREQRILREVIAAVTVLCQERTAIHAALAGKVRSLPRTMPNAMRKPSPLDGGAS